MDDFLPHAPTYGSTNGVAESPYVDEEALKRSDAADCRSGPASVNSPPQSGRERLLSRFCSSYISRRAVKPCETCQGTGYLSADSSELVALIPHGDSRLKPNYTKHYIALAVLVCVVIATILTVFLFPRSTTLNFKTALLSSHPVNGSLLHLNLQARLNVSNRNYLPLTIGKLNLIISEEENLAVTLDFNHSEVIPSRQAKVIIQNFTIPITTPHTVVMCTIAEYTMIFIRTRLTVGTVFLGSASQLTSTYFHY
eukprot:scpid94329/ scgid28124/ Transmembrane protein 106B